MSEYYFLNRRKKCKVATYNFYGSGYYSNFDKHHYKDVHRATPLALNRLGRFSLNARKFSVVIESAWGFISFMQFTHQSVPWMSVGQKVQFVTFSKFHIKKVYFSLFQKKTRNTKMSLRKRFSNFQYSFETRLQLIR